MVVIFFTDPERKGLGVEEVGGVTGVPLLPFGGFPRGTVV